jgi:hypothetical protein
MSGRRAPFSSHGATARDQCGWAETVAVSTGNDTLLVEVVREPSGWAKVTCEAREWLMESNALAGTPPPLDRLSRFWLFVQMVEVCVLVQWVAEVFRPTGMWSGLGALVPLIIASALRSVEGHRKTLPDTFWGHAVSHHTFWWSAMGWETPLDFPLCLVSFVFMTRVTGRQTEVLDRLFVASLYAVVCTLLCLSGQTSPLGAIAGLCAGLVLAALCEKMRERFSRIVPPAISSAQSSAVSVGRNSYIKEQTHRASFAAQIAMQNFSVLGHSDAEEDEDEHEPAPAPARVPPPAPPPRDDEVEVEELLAVEEVDELEAKEDAALAPGPQQSNEQSELP